MRETEHSAEQEELRHSLRRLETALAEHERPCTAAQDAAAGPALRHSLEMLRAEADRLRLLLDD